MPRPQSYPGHLLAHGDLLLALSLSAPAHPPAKRRNFSVEFTDDEVLVRTPYPHSQPSRSVRLLCSKETIAFALFLFDYRSRKEGMEAEHREQRITNAVSEFATARAQSEVGNRSRSLLSPESGPDSPPLALSFLRRSLDISDEFVAECDAHCSEVFSTLERNDLAIDPGFSPELVALCGLIPMQFSVRTERGEQTYRRFKIRAPLWTLDIDRVRKGRRIEYDWDFQLRGVDFVRGTLRRLAEQYLASEASERMKTGQPTIPPPMSVNLDAVDERQGTNDA